jgi:hypothetical protein
MKGVRPCEFASFSDRDKTRRISVVVSRKRTAFLTVGVIDAAPGSLLVLGYPFRALPASWYAK